MKKSEVIALSAMPLQSPTYPRGPYRFFNRQYMSLNYKTDPALIRAALPEPLEPSGDMVTVQWVDLPDGEGFGAYATASQVIPCTFKGEVCNFLSQMYVDNTPPLAGGREIWGLPMKYGKATLKVNADTLTGSLEYASQSVAVGTMVYKHDAFKLDHAKQKEYLARTQITLKLIPDIDGTPAIAQLVAVKFENIVIHGAWKGNARLELIPSVNCPLADLPVKQVVDGLHMSTDMTLPYGKVVHDYLAKK
jgi:acetoacetate decarboxylase